MKSYQNSKLHFFLLVLIILIYSCGVKSKNVPSSVRTFECDVFNDVTPSISSDSDDFIARHSNIPVSIDGCSKDVVWNKANWYSMDFLWMGEQPVPADFKGRFKLSWDKNYLYVLVEVTDDFLQPTLEDGIENFWKGDYIEVFIDEDQSGGDHKFNHQAFAYHVTTDGHAIDQGIDEKPIFLDDHIEVARKEYNSTHVWEMAIRLYDSSFEEGSKDNLSVEITKNKTIGFSIAYGDNDGNGKRENFMGSKLSHGINNDEGYVNSDVFGSLLFVK